MYIAVVVDRWSADTMAQYKREMRTQELLRRRHSLNSQLTDISHSNNGSSSSNISSSVAVATNSSSNRGGKNASYKTAATTSSSAGAKRGRQGKALTSATATSTATSSMHMNKAAKRFQKVYWQYSFSEM